ncbi:ATP-binding protein [Sphingobacterium bambusae]|uniref:histidine kinase n=1 Tax=Sphingobacterium bambusae TaxID=662858 RepID=A0ABW6BEM1_9SPHI|nr:ATP-binding protein [Sphingobacterium bambusae]WPL48687.1 PAS domain S-box protein [Sphingobacterium bambusae]
MLNSDQVLFEVLRFSPDATAVYDSADLRIAYANKRMCSLWALSDDYKGKLYDELFSNPQQKHISTVLRQVWETGESRTLYHVEVGTFVDDHWEPRYFDMELKVLLNSNSEVFAILHTGKEVSGAPSTASSFLFQNHLVDIDKRIEGNRLENVSSKNDAAEKLPEVHPGALYNMEQVETAILRAQLIKDVAQLGVFDINIQTNKLIWDKYSRNLFGTVPEKVHYTPLDLVNAVHHTDKLRLIKALADAYDAGITKGNLDIIVRSAVSSKPEIRQVHILGLVHFDDEKKPNRLLGTVRDVTETSNTMDALRKRDLELQEVNRALATLNTELMSLNQELESSNENLVQAEQITQSLNDELQSAFDKLKLNEDRMNLAIQSAELGTWTLDVTENKVFMDARAKELYGYPPGDLIDYEEVLRYMHKDDRELVHQAVQRAINPKSGGLYDIQFRTIGATDGRLRWLHCKGRAYFDELNQPILFSGTARDITEAVISNEKISRYHNLISEKEKILQLIVDSAQIGTFTFDLMTKDMELNAHARSMFGLAEEDDALHPSGTDETLQAYMEVAEQAMAEAVMLGQPYDYSYQITHKKTGKVRWLRSVGNGAENSDGSITMFYGVIIDITAQKEEEQRKIDFLSIASHELRSPLTSLSGYLQILTLKRTQMDEQRMETMIRNASRQSERMRVLIDSFLDIARVNEGKLQLQRQIFPVDNFLSDMEKTLAETTTSHKFVFSDETSGLMLYADRDKLEQVVINFINNAIKYTPSKTVIQVVATSDNDQLEVRVIDEGPGISPADQARIFDRFYRVDSPRNEHVNGFGIGLFISKEIIHLHEGTINLQSEEGRGTTFWFSIPILPAPILLTDDL